MKLSINQESVFALREFAAFIPKVMDQIESITDNLIHVFDMVSDTVGPHE